MFCFCFVVVFSFVAAVFQCVSPSSGDCPPPHHCLFSLSSQPLLQHPADNLPDSPLSWVWWRWRRRHLSVGAIGGVIAPTHIGHTQQAVNLSDRVKKEHISSEPPSSQERLLSVQPSIIHCLFFLLSKRGRKKKPGHRFTLNKNVLFENLFLLWRRGTA